MVIRQVQMGKRIVDWYDIGIDSSNFIISKVKVIQGHKRAKYVRKVGQVVGFQANEIQRTYVLVTGFEDWRLCFGVRRIR